jgi:CheY-like chemotaxis protein
VKLERPNAHFKISVVDDGEGIHAGFLPYVFERFRQADASTARRHGGLGLGLSIVKQLVELHGGHVHASSRGSGTGSTFTVELPTAAVDTHAAGRNGASWQPSRSVADHTAVQSPPPTLEGVRVLVVDDEPDARSLIERLLQDCEATVTTAGSAREALDCIARVKLDVLLSDIGMPHEDGYSMMRKIRRLEGEAGQIPAIALTAYARAEDRAKAIQAGYQQHLPKPVEPSTLIATVASLVKHRSPHVHRTA